ncbi:putative gamma carbonic anhydrase-like 1, mitochondrial [Iris pallida]|uniref:Gamma carbonic anhydrase-like 1, mitochondrial n=1 Tax=Iris pallida TaxID=29817 RepID=A0AAX6I8G0_IRIPA|nr:putative gamma carbonic anhydrase-like 1, mitochondrial [Iris pallida]
MISTLEEINSLRGPLGRNCATKCMMLLVKDVVTSGTRKLGCLVFSLRSLLTCL